MRRYTPTQQRILDLLSDGLAHSKRELFALLDDELAGRTAIRKHICLLRKLLPLGQTILCVYEKRQIMYRMVRFLSNSAG